MVSMYGAADKVSKTGDTMTGPLTLPGIAIAEGSNARSGTATLSAGAVTVSNTSVTANTRIQLTIQAPGGTVGAPYVFSRSAGTSFTIHSTSGSDTSVVAWLMVEPA